MKIVDYLIIGGSAAGTTAAEVIRSLAPDSLITIVTDEDHQEYSRVLLPHYIRHKVTREQIFLKKPEWYQEKKIELMKGTRVQRLEASNYAVSLDNGEEIKYGKLLIAIGGYVVKMQVPGSDLRNILYMRTIEDGDEIIKACRWGKGRRPDGSAQRGVIIGGGFIGLEFASCFKLNGVDEITILVRDPYYWSSKLDQDSSRVLQNVLEKNGCRVLSGEEVDHIDGNGRVEAVVTKSGKRIDADVIGIGIGIRSNLSWLEGSGLKVNRGIVINEYLEANLPDVFAAGDCAQFWDVIFERQHIMGNWANATSQGLAVGKTMAGVRTIFETASSYSINFFEGSCSFIGVTDREFADEVIKRGSVESGKMTRIFVKSIANVMRIVGATVINDPAEISPLTSAVKNRIDVATFKDKFGDTTFSLNQILL